MDVRELLNEEIRTELEAIGEMEQVGGDEYESAVRGVTQLTDRLIKMEELDVEKKKVDVDRKDKLIRNVITVVTAAAGMFITLKSEKRAYKFEEVGTITTKPGNKALDRALNYFFKK